MIHVLLTEDAPASLAPFSPAERARADAMRVPQRRKDFLLGRWAAKCLIASVLRRTAGPALEVRAAESGQPLAFADGAPLPLSISISHRAGLALAALDEGGAPIGADLERIEPRSDGFVRDFFTLSEALAVAGGERALLANLIWSAKESALKALGVGLRADTRSIEIELSPECAGDWHVLRVHGAPDLRGAWRRIGEHVATLVAASAGPVRFLQNISA
ncbi:MAG TPA: 4'-phosphopantetheinyl transferase superfamily protein [Myxococcales bacterium]|nr:4'-phosphopantetheinyl transferase superfamily protein [Myxococcales bacterium]